MQTSSISVESNGSEGIRFLQPQSFVPSEGYGELALLSKRKARSILNVGNDTLKRIIDEGKIKIIIVNGKEKIPYVSLQEYVYSMSFKNEIYEVEDQFIDEENAVVIANKILEEINKGG